MYITCKMTVLSSYHLLVWKISLIPQLFHLDSSEIKWIAKMDESFAEWESEWESKQLIKTSQVHTTLVHQLMPCEVKNCVCKKQIYH